MTFMRKLKKNQKHVHGKIFRLLVKLYAAATVFLLFFYCLITSVFDPGFLARDIENKYAKAADISMLMRIVGPPEKPIVRTSSSCKNGVSTANLSWNVIMDADTYNIYRDGSLLVSGIEENNYEDNSAISGKSHTYTVEAVGTLGTAESEEVMVAIRSCPILPKPSCKITEITSKKGYSRGVSVINSRKPTFSGSTNIPFAKITIIVHSRTISGTTVANENGYWSWPLPEEADLGRHNIAVSIIDQSDTNRSASYSMDFEIVEENNKSDEERETDDSTKNGVISTNNLIEKTSTLEQQFNTTRPESSYSEIKDAPKMLLSNLKTSNDPIYAGKDLAFDIHLEGNSSSEEMKVRYSIVDKNGNTLVEKRDIWINDFSNSLSGKLKLPRLAKEGKYFLSITALNEKFAANSITPIEIKQDEIISLYGSIGLTLLDIMNEMNFVIKIMLIILVSLTVLLSLEHIEAAGAVIQITEDILQKKGFFRGRKEVSS